jgi:hypothetical protein
MSVASTTVSLLAYTGPKVRTGGAGFSTLAAAQAVALADATILLHYSDLKEDLVVKDKNMILKGGFSNDFVTASGLMSVLNGTITIKGSSLKVSGVAVK